MILTKAFNLPDEVVNSLTPQEQSNFSYSWDEYTRSRKFSCFAMYFLDILKTFCGGGNFEPYSHLPLYFNVDMSPYANFKDSQTSTLLRNLWRKRLSQLLLVIFNHYSFLDEIQFKMDLELLERYLIFVHEIITKFALKKSLGSSPPTAIVSVFCKFSVKLHQLLLTMISFLDTTNVNDPQKNLTSRQLCSINLICARLGQRWDVLMASSEIFHHCLENFVKQHMEKELGKRKSKEFMLFFDYLCSINGDQKESQNMISVYWKARLQATFSNFDRLSPTMKSVCDPMNCLSNFKVTITTYLEDIQFLDPLMQHLPEFSWRQYGKMLATVALRYNEVFNNLIECLLNHPCATEGECFDTYECGDGDGGSSSSRSNYNGIEKTENSKDYPLMDMNSEKRMKELLSTMCVESFDKLDMTKEENQTKLHHFLSVYGESIVDALELLKKCFKFVENKHFL